MQTSTIRSAFLSALLLSTVFSGCTKSQSGSSGGSSGTTDGKSATTACGVVFGGKLRNPISLTAEQLVTVVNVVSNNLVSISTDGGSTRSLIKLQGVDNSPTAAKNTQAVETIKSMTAGGAYYFKATEDCSTATSGSIGTLVSKSGASVNEELVKRGFAPADTNDACRGDLLGSCFQALNESTDENQTSSNVGCGFLWKPESDKDGKLAVLVDECSVRVFVNGQELEQAGAGNGRCTTVRGDKSGCAYGQATVEIVDSFTGLPYVFKDGKTKLTLDGCSRFELPCE